MRTKQLVALAAAALLAITVAACGSDDDDAQATADSIKQRIEDAKDAGGGDGLLGGGDAECPDPEKMSGKMRVVHLAAADGKALDPVDVYAQGYGPDQNCDPLIEGLSYGQVSDYVELPVAPFSDGTDAGLMYYDAGVKDRTGFWQGNAPNDGVNAKGDLETVILSGGLSEGPAAPSWTDVTERSTEQPDAGPEIADGKALLYVSEAGAYNALQQQGDDSNLYFTIDGRCQIPDPPEDDFEGTGSPGSMSGNAAPFTVEPGTHTVGIIVTEPGVGIGNEDCDGNTPTITDTVEAKADTATAVYVGGPSKDALQLLVADIELD